MSLPGGNVRLRCGQCGWHGRKLAVPATGSLAQAARFRACPRCGTRLKAVVSVGGGR